MVGGATAVVFESPGHLALREVGLPVVNPTDCMVDVEWTGVSTGTERLLWTGEMPPFPGLAYPLVPGYESVGRVVSCGAESTVEPGTRVFIPGSRGFTDVHGLFGGAAHRLVVDSSRLMPLERELGEKSTLLALSATALHALNRVEHLGTPELIIGHGVLGRLMARLAVARGAKDLTVWETNPVRRSGNVGYSVIDPTDDPRSDYLLISDVSGDSELLDSTIGRCAKGGTVLLAGFYHAPLSFSFAPAFMREISLLIASEWQASDMESAAQMIESDQLNLSDLITHRFRASDAGEAYNTAFSDPECLKAVLDWRSL